MLISKTYSEIIDHDSLPSIKVFAIGEDAISAMSSVAELYEGCINYIALSVNLNELTSSKANIQLLVDNTAKNEHAKLIPKIKCLVKETDLVIIIADMQNTLYSNIAVEIAKASIAEDNLTVAIENSATQERDSNPNILDFEKALDAVINVNDGIIDLGKNSDDKTLDDKKIASELIAKAVNTIVYPLVYISFIAIDYADLKSLLKKSGKTVVATLKSTSISNLKAFVERLHLKPRGSLFNISTNSNFLTSDFKKVLDEIERCFDDDCKEHVCLYLDDSIPKDTFNISILVCGL